LKSVFAPIVGASQFCDILISITIFTISHIIIGQCKPLPYSISRISMKNFSTTLTTKCLPNFLFRCSFSKVFGHFSFPWFMLFMNPVLSPFL
jgi:hypothetical protein